MKQTQHLEGEMIVTPYTAEDKEEFRRNQPLSVGEFEDFAVGWNETITKMVKTLEGIYAVLAGKGGE